MSKKSRIKNFYLDENLPPKIARALNALEGDDGHNVYHTGDIFEKGIKDVELIPLVAQQNGILMTKDLKMKTRRIEFKLIQESGITVFFISIPSGAKFELEYQFIISKWEDIKKICNSNKHPFLYQVQKRGGGRFL